VLEYRVLEQAPDPTAADAFRRWSKKGKKLRRALKPVRDADGFLAKLESIRGDIEWEPDSKLRVSPQTCIPLSPCWSHQAFCAAQ